MAEHPPIVDTHAHFWDPDHLRYPWFDGSLLLNRRYALEEYEEATEGLPVEGVVFVQAECLPGQAIAEAEWVMELAGKEPRIQGIVAHAPLELGPGVEGTLAYLSKTPLVKGIRRLLQTEPDPRWCLSDGFVAGTRLLAKYGLSLDFGLRRDQLPAAAELAKRCPEVQFIVDHLGGPPIREEAMAPWDAHIRDLAALPNVYCKMSGVATAAHHDTWRPEDLKPYIDHVVDCFGYERIAYGSDWPVMLLATPYRRWVETLDWAIHDASPADKARLYHGTAREFYRLGGE